MFKTALLFLLATSLFASTPKIYAALGDIIYNNAPKIEKLSELEIYRANKKSIKEYVAEVERVKKMGFNTQASKDKMQQKAYLQALRKLSNDHDFFMRSVEKNYENILQNNLTKDFNAIVNSGLIKSESRKAEILHFYYAHKSEIKPSGVLERFVMEDKEAKRKRDAKLVKKKTKEATQREKIERIRQNDILAQERLEKRLQSELSSKKSQIRKDQEEELGN